MVEQIEELSPELQIHALAERQRKILDDRKIGVHKSRTVERRARGSAKFSGWRRRKSAGIKPILEGVNLARAVCLAPFRSWLVGITDLVGTRVSVAVIGEKHTRRVAAVDHE